MGAESSTKLIFFAPEPDAYFAEQVLRYKRLTHGLVGQQTFLNHLPHLTLYVGMFPQAAVDTASAVAKCWAVQQPAPRAAIRGWHVFRDDPFTGGHTIVCKLDEVDADRLRDLQQDLVETVSPLRDQAASEARVQPRWARFSDSERAAARRFGFPFIGDGWHPHVSIASISPEVWAKVWPVLEGDPPDALVIFPRLGVYGHDDAGEPALISHFDLAIASPAG